MGAYANKESALYLIMKIKKKYFTEVREGTSIMTFLHIHTEPSPNTKAQLCQCKYNDITFSQKITAIEEIHSDKDHATLFYFRQE